MRTYILIIVITAICGGALLRARIGLYGYIWFALMRPDYFAWGQGLFPFSPLLEVATILGSVPELIRHGGTILVNPLSRILILLQIPIALSTVFAVDRSLSLTTFLEYERVIIMCLLIPILIRTENQLRTLFFIIALSIGVLGIKFALMGVSYGGIAVGYGGLENNGLALALVMTIPFLWYSSSLVESMWIKALMFGLVVTASAAVLMTYSRGGSLALFTTGILIAWRSKHRMAMAFLCLLSLVPAAFVFSYQFGKYMERMSTLKDPLEDISANSRIVQARRAVTIWTHYPFLGVGFGNDNYRVLQAAFYNLETADFSQVLKVHNSYLQLLVDCGIFALLLFLLLLFGAIWRLRRSIRFWKKARPGKEAYPLAMQTALVAYAQFSLTGGREMYIFFYIVLMTAAAWLHIQKQLQAELPSTASAIAPSLPAPGILSPRAVPQPAGLLSGIRAHSRPHPL